MQFDFPPSTDDSDDTEVGSQTGVKQRQLNADPKKNQVSYFNFFISTHTHTYTHTHMYTHIHTHVHMDILGGLD